MQETWVQFRGQEDPLEKEMAIHSSILGWIIPTDREAWQATVQGVTRVIHNLATKPPLQDIVKIFALNRIECIPSVFLVHMMCVCVCVLS